MFCLMKLHFKRLARCVSRVKIKYACAAVILIFTLDLFGVFTHIFEVPYTDNFIYPYNGDIESFIDALRHNKKPEIEPLNNYNYTFIHNPKDKCVDPDSRRLRIVFLVKSAMKNFQRREGIRNSWGFGKRFFDVPTRLIFLLGNAPEDESLNNKISNESEKYKDILQGDIVDTYYNNTLKTMMGFKWAVDHCTNSKFYMFVDDDIYVSVKNILRFVRNPASYPDYLKEPDRMAARKREIKASDLQTDSVDVNNSSYLFQEIQKPSNIQILASKGLEEKVMSFKGNNVSAHNFSVSTEKDEQIEVVATRKDRKKRQVFDLELPEDVRLFAGYVFVSSPHRHKTSKWYVSLKEYPYHMWPPYITAGAYILSKEALLDMYYASMFTQLFKFDDIFLGIVAKKADIEPFHCDEFHFYKKDYTKYNYKYVITSHGYDNPKELMAVWHEQKSLGNA